MLSFPTANHIHKTSSWELFVQHAAPGPHCVKWTRRPLITETRRFPIQWMWGDGEQDISLFGWTCSHVLAPMQSEEWRKACRWREALRAPQRGPGMPPPWVLGNSARASRRWWRLNWVLKEKQKMRMARKGFLGRGNSWVDVNIPSTEVCWAPIMC